LKNLITFNFLEHFLIELDHPQNHNVITTKLYTFNQLKIETTD